MTLVALDIDFDDARERSARVAAFSNGYEAEDWQDAWCGTCRHDSQGVVTPAGQAEVFCPLVDVALLGRTPAEWTEIDRTALAGRYRCERYEARPGERDACETVRRG